MIYSPNLKNLYFGEYISVNWIVIAGPKNPCLLPLKHIIPRMNQMQTTFSMEMQNITYAAFRLLKNRAESLSDWRDIISGLFQSSFGSTAFFFAKSQSAGITTPHLSTKGSSMKPYFSRSVSPKSTQKSKSPASRRSVRS